LQGKWIAIDHLKWFLGDGSGADFVEDSNLDLMLRTDSGVQAVLRAKIPTGRSIGTFADHVEIKQSDYDDDEFQYATAQSIGSISRSTSLLEPSMHGSRIDMNGIPFILSTTSFPTMKFARQTASTLLLSN